MNCMVFITDLAHDCDWWIKQNPSSCSAFFINHQPHYYGNYITFLKPSFTVVTRTCTMIAIQGCFMRVGLSSNTYHIPLLEITPLMNAVGVSDYTLFLTAWTLPSLSRNRKHM